jgi:hypothetical protein
MEDATNIDLVVILAETVDSLCTKQNNGKNNSSENKKKVARLLDDTMTQMAKVMGDEEEIEHKMENAVLKAQKVSSIPTPEGSTTEVKMTESLSSGNTLMATPSLSILDKDLPEGASSISVKLTTPDVNEFVEGAENVLGGFVDIKIHAEDGSVLPLGTDAQVTIEIPLADASQAVNALELGIAYVKKEVIEGEPTEGDKETTDTLSTDGIEVIRYDEDRKLVSALTTHFTDFTIIKRSAEDDIGQEDPENEYNEVSLFNKSIEANSLMLTSYMVAFALAVILN